MSEPLDRVIQSLHERGKNPQEKGDHYEALCPAHDDTNPSLTIRRADSGTVLIKCQSLKCSADNIVKAIGLTMKDLFPPSMTNGNAPPRSNPTAANGKTPPASKPAAKKDKVRPTHQTLDVAIASTARMLKASHVDTWHYSTFVVARFKLPNGKKEYRPFHQAASGWVVGDPPGNLPLYRLDDLAGAETVWVFEGEKCAELARGIGLVATTSAHGAQSAGKSDWTPLAGKPVVIFPDHGEGGKNYPAGIAPILTALDPPARVKIVELPGLREGEDIEQWLEAHDSWDSGQCRAELERLAKEAPEWVRPAEPADAAGGGAALNGSEPDIERLEVAINPNESVVNDQAASALSRIPGLYQRNFELVRVVQASESAHGDPMARAAGSPTIRALTPSAIREVLTMAVKFVREKSQPDSESVKSHSHPPAWCVNALAARDNWRGVPNLTGLAEMPFLRSDGTAVTKSGFDQQTGILLILSGEFPPIPENPDQDDARKAADVVFDIVQDFPFLPGHPAVLLAALLTPIARHLIDGPCPLFLFDAPTPGSGKSLLADLCAIITTGREMPRTGYQHDPVETDKQIVATCVAGDRNVLFDNLEHGARFGNSALDRALTARTYRGRILGKSEMKILPLDTVFYASGNNVSLTGDITRRVMPCRLESEHERPETRPANDFAVSKCDCGCKGSLLHHAKRKRPELAIAALTILRAYILAGMPQPQDLPPLGGFQEWSQLIRGAVVWATGIDPAIGRETLVDSDQTNEYHTAFVDGWHEVQLSQNSNGMTTGDMRKALADPDNAERFTKIRDAISGLWPRLKTEDLPTPGSIGKKIQAIRGKWHRGKKFARITAADHTNVWSVQESPKR